MPYMYGCPKRPEEDIKSPETGVTGSCELPCMGAGNWMQVL